MEGAPFSSNESPDDRQHEAADSDDSKDEKDKKKRRRSSDAGAAVLHASRLDFDSRREKDQEHEKTSDRLGELTLSDAFGIKRDNDASSEKSGGEKPKTAEEKPRVPVEKAEEPLSEAEHETAQDEKVANEGKVERLPQDNKDDEASSAPEEYTPVVFAEAQTSKDESRAVDESLEAGEGTPDISVLAKGDSEAQAGGFSSEAATEPEPGPTEDELPVDSDDQYAPIEVSDTSGNEELDGKPDDEGGDSPVTPTPPAGSGASAGSMPPPGRGGSGSGNLPPSSPPSRPTPTPSPVPAPPSPGGGSHPAYNGAPNVAPVANAEKSIVIEKHNHFWAGVVVGGLYEHFKHKKRENKLKKEIDAQKDELTQHNERQQRTSNEVEKLKQEQADQSRIIAQHERAAKQEEAHSEKTRQKSTVSRVGEITTETITMAEAASRLQTHSETALPEPERTAAEVHENGAPREEVLLTPFVPLTMPERSSPSSRPEWRDVPSRATPLGNERGLQTDAGHSKPEVAPQPRENEDEPLQVSDDHRIEQSSWLSMEVDKRTGRVVENQTFMYGQGFEQERHEVGAQPTDDMQARQVEHSTDGNFTAQGGAVTGGGSASSVSPAGAPNAVAQKANTVEETQRIGGSDSSGMAVVIAGAAVVAVIALLVLLLV